MSPPPPPPAALVGANSEAIPPLVVRLCDCRGPYRLNDPAATTAMHKDILIFTLMPFPISR